MAKRIKKAETAEWEVLYRVIGVFSSTGAVNFTEVFHYKFEVNQVPSLLDYNFFVHSSIHGHQD